MLHALSLHFALVGALALAALWVGRGARRSELAHQLWVAVFVVLAIPPVVELPLLPAPELPSAPPLAPMAPAGGTEAIPMQAVSLELLGARASEAASSEPRWSPLQLLLALWVAGSLLQAARMLWGSARMARVLRAASAPDAELAEALNRAARELGLMRLPAVRVIEGALSPALWPPLRPRVLLSRALLDALSPAELHQVLLHELMHCARRDPLVRVLESLVLCAYWWLPPVHWFRRELRFCEEAACDAGVLRATRGEPARYAEALIRTVSVLAGSERAPLPSAATAAANTRPIQRRIVRIMQSQDPRPLSAWRRRALLGCALCVAPLLPTRAQADLREASAPAHPQPFELHAPAIDLQGLEQALAFDADDELEPTLTERERAQLQEVLELVAAGDLQAALGRLGQLAQGDSSASFDFTRANLHLQLGQVELALTAYERAVVKHPRFRRAWRNLGLQRAQQGEYAKAQTALQRVIDLGGGDATVWGLSGFALSALGEYARAESAFWMALRLEPEQEDWTAGLLRCLVSQERYASVVSMVERMREEGRSNTELDLLLANSWIALERPGKAAELYAAVAERGAATADVLYSLGDIRFNEGQVEEAVQAWSQAIRKDAQRAAEQARRRVELLSARGQAELAQLLLEAVDASSDEAQPPTRDELSMRLRLVDSQREPERAEALLRQILERTPEDGEAWLQLGRLCAELGRSEEAKQCYERAMEIEGYESDALVRSGQLFVEQGDYAAALPLLYRALDLDPERPLFDFVEQVERVAGVGAAPIAELVQLDRAPRALEQAPPAFSPELRALAPAAVTLEVVVGTRGNVESALAVESSDERFEASAVAAAMQWRFTPATRDGARVRYRMRLPVRFPARDAAPAEVVEVVSVLELDVAPRALYRPAPVLSAELRARTPASVTLLFEVDAAGRVRAARVHSSSDPAFERAALQAVESWRFEPGRRDGQPVAYRMRVPLSFPASEEEPAEEEPLLLAMTPEGAVVHDGREIGFDGARDLVRSRVEAQPGLLVVIEANPELPTEEIVRLFDEAKQAGARHVVFGTRTSDEEDDDESEGDDG